MGPLMSARHYTIALGLLAVLTTQNTFAQQSSVVGSLVEQGRYWQSRGDYKRAAEVWDKLLVANPGNPDALYGLARAALAANDLVSANSLLERLRAASPRSSLLPLLEQEVYLAQPGPRAELDKARSLAAAQQMDEAIAQYDKVLRGQKPLGSLAREYYNYLGYSSQGLERSIQGLEEITQSSPDNLNDQLSLAKQLIRSLDRRQEGLTMLERLSKQPAVASEATEAWRSALTWIGPPPPAYRAAFEAYLKANPSDDEIRKILNSARANASSPTSNNTKPSERAATPPAQNPKLARGFQLLEAGNLAQAEASFREVLQRDPRDADALGGLGLIYMQNNDFARAEELLAVAANRKSGWKRSLGVVKYWKLVNESNTVRQQGNTAQARSLAEQAIKMDNKTAAAHNALGGAYAKEGQNEKAAQAFRQALKADSANPEALQGLAEALTNMGSLDEAATLVNKLSSNQQLDASQVSKLRATLTTSRARQAIQRGDTANAQRALEDALRDEPNNPWIRLELARLYAKNGAITEARGLVDGLLLSHPNMPDALYSSALLSLELGEWNNAYNTLQRIAPADRTREMSDLLQRTGIQAQSAQAATLASQGKLAEAQSLLLGLEQSTANDPGLTSAVASAWVDAGNSGRGLALMRKTLESSGSNNPDALLAYAGLLLKTEQDVEAAGIMRSLQTKSLTPSQQEAYNNLAILYTVRQADLLRQRGDLVRAYDTLAPVLSQRPNDPAALAALARMYADNGDHQQAFDYYQRLLKDDQDNASLQIAAAMAATQLGDKQYAERAINHALSIAPDNPEILANAARLYRAQGKTSKAMDLFTAAVAAENKKLQLASVQPVDQAPAQPQTPAYINPFAQKAAVQPPALQNNTFQPKTTPSQVAMPMATLPLPANNLSAAAPTPVSATAPGPAISLLPPTPNNAAQNMAFAAPNPTPPAPVTNQAAAEIVASSRLTALNKELADLRDLRNPEVKLATTGRSNNGESGLSKLTDMQTSLSVQMPVGDGKLTLEATAVKLKSGEISQNYYSLDRFGGGPVAIYDGIAQSGQWGNAQALNTITPSGKQQDSGVGLSAAYEYQGLKVDIGTTPLGFIRNNIIGGLKYDGMLDSQNRSWYSVDVSRRPVTDSLTSFAGAHDSRTDMTWGGVTSTGVRLQAGQDTDDVGYYGYGSWHALRGHNVASNSRTNVGAGVYWHLVRESDQLLTAGLNLDATFYEKNQRFFTYGHGGYFSPQSMYSLSVPITWAQRSGRFSYKLQGSLGVEHFEENDADYFPTDSSLQARAQTATQYARALGLTGATSVYSGQSKTGLSYNLAAAAEYRLTNHLVLGSQLGLNNAKDYRQWAGGLYMRYTFYPSNKGMDLPITPYRGPYAN
ncbi:cellulose synthase [Pusillimonas sp. T2]|nr:cellulose synthase [Pusillimonas sp. T2]